LCFAGARLESNEHELTVNKLIALAEIYSIPTDRLMRSIYPGKEHAPDSQSAFQPKHKHVADRSLTQFPGETFKSDYTIS
jgi:hypothetical protein